MHRNKQPLMPPSDILKVLRAIREPEFFTGSRFDAMTREADRVLPLSLTDRVLTDEDSSGAVLNLSDTNTETSLSAVITNRYRTRPLVIKQTDRDPYAGGCHLPEEPGTPRREYHQVDNNNPKQLTSLKIAKGYDLITAFDLLCFCQRNSASCGGINLDIRSIRNFIKIAIVDLLSPKGKAIITINAIDPSCEGARHRRHVQGKTLVRDALFSMRDRIEVSISTRVIRVDDLSHAQIISITLRKPTIPASPTPTRHPIADTGGEEEQRSGACLAYK
ncbi:MAG: hypothetical protein P1U34_07225 [Coxiellaceae bacterium]|nr:hypothetical protein [Coxiellaceae bacterium]